MATSSLDIGKAAEPVLLQTPKGALEYAVWGEGASVLCLHGALGGYDQGFILARTLGEPDGYRYLTVSRPGYLRTPLRLGKSPAAQADLYARLLDALGADKSAVLAVSGGGPSAIQFALRHPKRCAALVLVSTIAETARNRLPLRFYLLKLTACVPWLAASAQRALKKDPERAARRSLTDPVLFERTRRDAEAWELLQQLQYSTVDQMAKRLAGTQNDVAVTRIWKHRLEDLCVPTLIVHGTRDSLAPFAENAKVFESRIPGAELLPLEGGEHSAIFSHRGQAQQRVIEFLRSHR